MTESDFWAMTAASIYGIGFHPKNLLEGTPMTAEQAGKHADALLLEFRKRSEAQYFHG